MQERVYGEVRNAGGVDANEIWRIVVGRKDDEVERSQIEDGEMNRRAILSA